MMKWIHDQLYFANWLIFALIVWFSTSLSKKNMKKEVGKITRDLGRMEKRLHEHIEMDRIRRK